MYYALILAFVFVAVIGWFVRKRLPASGAALTGVGACGCIVVFGWQLLQFLPGSGLAVTNRSQSALAYVMGQQALQDLQAREGKIALIFPPEGAVDSSQLDSYFEAFARILLRSPKLGVEEVQLKIGIKEARRGQIPSASFLEAIESTREAVAFVSWVGWPPQGEELSVLDRKPRPNIYVYDPFNSTNWVSDLNAGRIKLVVIPRPDAEDRGDAPNVGGPGQIFNRDFIAVTPETLNSSRSDAVAP